MTRDEFRNRFARLMFDALLASEHATEGVEVCLQEGDLGATLFLRIGKRCLEVRSEFWDGTWDAEWLRYWAISPATENAVALLGQPFTLHVHPDVERGE